MKFIKSYKNQIIFCLIGILFGFFLERIAHIKFDDTINPVDFANLLLTLILAMFIGYFVQPATENLRAEKDLHIEQLKLMKECARDINAFYLDNLDLPVFPNEKKLKLLSLFRGLSNQFEFFLSQANHSSLTLVTNQRNQILLPLFRYKRSLTGGPFNLNSFALQNVNTMAVDSAYTNVVRKINELIIDINKL